MEGGLTSSVAAAAVLTRSVGKGSLTRSADLTGLFLTAARRMRHAFCDFRGAGQPGSTRKRAVTSAGDL